MKRFKSWATVLLNVVFLMTFEACSGDDYDDSILTGRVNDLESRVEKLEELCKQMNTNISSLQTLVTALQKNDYITTVLPVTQGDETIGYTISFKESSPITIYHGKDGANGSDGEDGQDGTDGKDGTTPVLGVKQYTDGLYYWTLNGEWLKDDKGGMVRAQGVDGITPLLKIENDFWYISYDNELTWKELGKSINDIVCPFFLSVTEDDDFLHLTLDNGSTFSFPKYKPITLDLGDLSDISVLPNQTYSIPYVLQNTTETTKIKAIAQDGYKVNINKVEQTAGFIEITTPTEVLNSEILIFIWNKNEPVVMASISIVEGVIDITTKSYVIEAEGGQIDLNLTTNMTFNVEIPAEAQEWISISPMTKNIRNEILSFTVKPNDSSARNTTISLIDPLGVTIERVVVSQKGNTTQTIHVEVAGTLSSLISDLDIENIEKLKITGTLNNGDYQFLYNLSKLKELDLTKLDDETLSTKAFCESSISTVLLPEKLKVIPDSAFYQSQINSIVIPESVEDIGNYAFYETKNLNSNIKIPIKTTSIGDYAFTRSTFNGTLTLQDGLNVIGDYAFYGCKNVTGDLIIPNSVTQIGKYSFASTSFSGTLQISTEITEIPEAAFASPLSGTLIIPENVTTISESAFSGTNFSGDLVIPDKVTYIGKYAFYRCTGFNGALTIGQNVKTIGNFAFVYNSGTNYSNLRFDKVYCKASTPPTISVYTFNGAYATLKYLGVPKGRGYLYNKAAYWSKFINIEEVSF